MNKTQINIGDYVYTFIKSDKYPIARRRIRMIIENDKGVRLDLIPNLGLRTNSRNKDGTFAQNTKTDI